MSKQGHDKKQEPEIKASMPGGGTAGPQHPEATNGLESVTASATVAVPLHEQIAALAYELWKERGGLEGSEHEDWFEAERQLQGGSGIQTGATLSGSHHPGPGSHSQPDRGGKPWQTHGTTAEQTREARESEEARQAEASIRDRMVNIGRGNQQAGRQGS